MFCKNCGQELANDAEFCRKCGTSVNAKNIVSKSSTNKFSKLVTAMMIADTITLSIIAVFMAVLFINVSTLDDKVTSIGGLKANMQSADEEVSDGENEDGERDADTEYYNREGEDVFDNYNFYDGVGGMTRDDDDPDWSDEEESDPSSELTASDFLGTWSYISYKTEKTVTFYSDGTFSGSVPIYYNLPEKLSLFTLNNGTWSFLEQEKVLSVRDIMYSFSPSKIAVEISGDTLTLFLTETGNDTCVLTKVE